MRSEKYEASHWQFYQFSCHLCPFCPNILFSAPFLRILCLVIPLKWGNECIKESTNHNVMLTEQSALWPENVHSGKSVRLTNVSFSNSTRIHPPTGTQQNSVKVDLRFYVQHESSINGHNQNKKMKYFRSYNKNNCDKFLK